MIPRRDGGGPLGKSNLVMACQSCNNDRTNVAPEEHEARLARRRIHAERDNARRNLLTTA